MLFLLFLLIQLGVGGREEYYVGEDITFYVDDHISFGFEAGGHATIFVYPTETMVFGLIESNEYDQYNDVSNVAGYCGENPVMKISNYQIYCSDRVGRTLEATIEKGGVYFPFYLVCSSKGDTREWITTYSFRNPNSWLDYRWGTSKIYLPILVGLYGLMLIAWLVHQRFYGNPKIGIHRWITLGLSAGFVMQCTLNLTILIRDKAGSPEYVFRQWQLGIFGNIWNIIYESILLLTLVFAVNGWSTVNQTENGQRGKWIVIVQAGCWAVISIGVMLGNWSNIHDGSATQSVTIVLYVGRIVVLGVLLFVPIRGYISAKADQMQKYVVGIRDVILDRRQDLTKLLNRVTVVYMCVKAVYLGFAIYLILSPYFFYDWLIIGVIDAVLWGYIAWIFRLHDNYTYDYVVDE